MRILVAMSIGVAAGLSGTAMAAETIRPGQWEMVHNITDVSIPGAPPGMAEMMKSKPTTIRHCVTPEESALTFSGTGEVFLATTP